MRPEPAAHARLGPFSRTSRAVTGGCAVQSVSFPRILGKEHPVSMIIPIKPQAENGRPLPTTADKSSLPLALRATCRLVTRRWLYWQGVQARLRFGNRLKSKANYAKRNVTGDVSSAAYSGCFVPLRILIWLRMKSKYYFRIQCFLQMSGVVARQTWAF
jgi:hypothetical protein